MTPHPIHSDVDCIECIANYIDPSYHVVFKHVCRDYRAVLPVKTKSVIADYTSSVSMIQWARANGCPWNKNMCSKVARGGHLEVLQWAHANGCPWDEDTCFWAAGCGHLEVLQWAHANGCPWDEDTCYSAAVGGHLEVLQWARANGCPCVAELLSE